MDWVTFLRGESEKFTRGMERISERRRNWASLEERAVAQYQNLCAAAKTVKLFDTLYVDHTSARSISDRGVTNFVTLFWGRHPTGQADFRDGMRGSLVTESGCALHLVQGQLGEIVAVFYPFKTDLGGRQEKAYVYKTYMNPDRLCDKELKRLAQLMLVYAQVSSFAGSPTWIDQIKFKWLQSRSLVRQIWHSDWFALIQTYAERVFKLIPASSDSDKGAE